MPDWMRIQTIDYSESAGNGQMPDWMRIRMIYYFERGR